MDNELARGKQTREWTRQNGSGVEWVKRWKAGKVAQSSVQDPYGGGVVQIAARVTRQFMVGQRCKQENRRMRSRCGCRPVGWAKIRRFVCPGKKQVKVAKDPNEKKRMSGCRESSKGSACGKEARLAREEDGTEEEECVDVGWAGMSIPGGEAWRVSVPWGGQEGPESQAASPVD